MKARIFFLSFSREKAAEIPEDYLSFTIDTSLIAGGHWWGSAKGTMNGVARERTVPLDLRAVRLLELSRHLSPAILRIGGTEADRMGYRLKKKKKYADQAIGQGLTLKRKLWKKINSFARNAGFSILFTVSAGPGNRDENGAWIDGEARELIAFTAKRKYPVAAWELGNEVNGFPFIFGFRSRVSAAQYIRDFAVFSRLVKELHPAARVVGPASAVWPVIGEPNGIISALGKSAVFAPGDVMSWHYYPQQSGRGGFAVRRASETTLLSPRRLDGIIRLAERIRKAARGREIWLTETGHALYGGEPGISDTYLSTIWWLDELGLLARRGVSRVFRQTLAGSDYGLLDEKTFSPRPDYFASFLWKKLMGREVFNAPRIDGPDGKLRGYLHSSVSAPGRFSLLLINLSDSPAQAVFAGRILESWILAPEGIAASHRMTLNGRILKEDILRGWKKKKVRRTYHIGEAEKAELPPFGCAFFVISL